MPAMHASPVEKVWLTSERAADSRIGPVLRKKTSDVCKPTEFVHFDAHPEIIVENSDKQDEWTTMVSELQALLNATSLFNEGKKSDIHFERKVTFTLTRGLW